MWKRRAEIAALALLIAIAGGTGTSTAPRVALSAPTVDLAIAMPERIDSLADIGRVAVSAALLLLD